MGKFKFLEQENLIISLFQSGKKYTEIAQILNSSDIQNDAQNIRRLIHKKLGNVKSNNKGVIYEYKNSIMDLYREGKTPKEISQILNINFSTLCGWFASNRIYFKPDKGNTHYFETIDSYAKAYIVGFIAADGALVKSKCSKVSTLTITIKYEDREVLDFIKSEIGSSHKLQEIIRPSLFNKNKIIHHIRYAITDANIEKDLNKLGITNNKSLTMGNIIQNIPYDYRDAFIIGYFDGDGSVSTRNGLYENDRGSLCRDYSLYVQIRGTKEFFEGICDHLKIDKSHIHQNDSIPQLTFANKKDTMRLYKCYNHLPFYYKRKHDKFLEKINLPCYDKYR